MQTGGLGLGFTNRDGSSPPNESPLSVGIFSGTPTKITIPGLAPGKRVTHMRIKTSATLRYGDNATLDGTAGKGFATVLANATPEYIPVKGMAAIWLGGDAGTAIVDYSFIYE